MTRREFGLLLAGALNEQSRQIIRAIYARGHRGERSAGKLAPTVATGTAPNKTPKVRGNDTEGTQEGDL